MTREKREPSLEEYVQRLGGEKYSVLEKVYKKWLEDKLVLVDPEPPRDFVEYLRRLDYSLWFWTTLILVVVTLASIYLSSLLPPIIYARYVLGTIFVLFIPGYTLIEALYPEEKDLTPLERLALSIGLSLAVTPLIGLVLNYTPWGIRLEPILASLTLFTLTILFLAAWRKHNLITTQRKLAQTKIILGRQNKKTGKQAK